MQNGPPKNQELTHIYSASILNLTEVLKKKKSKPTIPFLLHSEWDPPPQQQLFLIRLQSSAEYWYLHQTTNSQSQGDYDTNQLPSQVWNKEDIEILKYKNM